MGKMTEKPIPLVPDRGAAVQRLTALWALNESGLGGVVHALKIPFTGILVGGTAILIITLIAFFAEHKARAVLRALVFVIVIKAAAAPHTPLPAYFAVAFQGLAGALLFSLLPGTRLPAMLLAVTGLLEGAAQKLIVMTIVFGGSLWRSLDLVGRHVASTLHLSVPEEYRFSGLVIGALLAYHLAGGVLIGAIAGGLPDRLLRELEKPMPAAAGDAEERTGAARPSQGKRWRKRILHWSFLLLFILLVLAFLGSEGGLLHRLLRPILRTAVALGVWFLFVAPLFRLALSRLRNRQMSRHAREIDDMQRLLPRLRVLAGVAWRETRGSRASRRWPDFLIRLAARALTET